MRKHPPYAGQLWRALPCCHSLLSQPAQLQGQQPKHLLLQLLLLSQLPTCQPYYQVLGFSSFAVQQLR
jgi:hypothetical protein